MSYIPTAFLKIGKANREAKERRMEVMFRYRSLIRSVSPTNYMSAKLHTFTLFSHDIQIMEFLLPLASTVVLSYMLFVNSNFNYKIQMIKERENKWLS